MEAGKTGQVQLQTQVLGLLWSVKSRTGEWGLSVNISMNGGERVCREGVRSSRLSTASQLSIFVCMEHLHILRTHPLFSGITIIIKIKMVSIADNPPKWLIEN